MDQAYSQPAAYGVYPGERIPYSQSQLMPCLLRKHHAITLVSQDLSEKILDSIRLSETREPITMDFCWGYRTDNTNPLIPAMIQQAFHYSGQPTR